LRQMGHKNSRVGFVTTEKTPSLLDQAISNGAMFILHKPFDDAELAAAVVSSVKDLAQLAHPEPKPAAAPAKAEVPAAAPVPATAAAPFDPVPEAALQTQLQSFLGNIPFRLVAGDAMTTAKLTPNNVLGLYVAASQRGVYAIGVLDANAICMIGGGAARKGPPEVRAAMESGMPDSSMLEKANEFLRLMAPALGATAPATAGAVTLGKASIVKNTFAKLAEVMLQSGRRSDFRISIPGYGEGRLAFFVMAA
jgi:hypothetical protein